MTDKLPWDLGTWTCENCGIELIGERAEPPLYHVHGCEGASGRNLIFKEDN